MTVSDGAEPVITTRERNTAMSEPALSIVAPSAEVEPYPRRPHRLPFVLAAIATVAVAGAAVLAYIAFDQRHQIDRAHADQARTQAGAAADLAAADAKLRAAN